MKDCFNINTGELVDYSAENTRYLTKSYFPVYDRNGTYIGYISEENEFIDMRR